MPERERRIVYLQYCNPGAYPPLAHSSRILAGEGWEVLFVGIGAFGGADALALAAHANVRSRMLPFRPPGYWQKLHYLRFALLAAWTAIRWRPQWIYVSDPLACPAGALLARLGPWRVLYHEHDTPTEDQGRRPNWFARAVLRSRRHVARLAQLCVLPNAKRAEIFRNRTGASNPVVTVWNCPSLAEAHVPLPARGERPFVVFYHGSIVPSRLPLALVDGFARLPSFALLRIAGYETIDNVGYLRALQDEAARLGVASRLQYLGALSRAELLPQCRLADVGVSLLPLASNDLNEREMTGASNKAFDYMACGLPVLVPHIPAWVDMFVLPGYGIACDPGDPAGIAEALRSLMDDPTEARRMGECALERIKREWNYEAQFECVRRRLEQS
ncbi:MAG: glycosyltransferase [Usitatibacter sp.]